MSLPLDLQQLENVQINGLVPFIYSITPVTNLQLLFVGADNRNAANDLSFVEEYRSKYYRKKYGIGDSG